jgi:hypothetical protein
VLSCSEGRQWQIGAREVVEDGGRECELRAGWIRRMFSGASRPGLVWSVPWDWRARAGACPRALDDGWPLPLRHAPAMAKLEFSPAATSIDLEGEEDVIKLHPVRARQRVRERVEGGRGFTADVWEVNNGKTCLYAAGYCS